MNQSMQDAKNTYACLLQNAAANAAMQGIGHLAFYCAHQRREAIVHNPSMYIEGRMTIVYSHRDSSVA